jgi:hypothetical protein
MNLGKDFVMIARLILWIIRALLQFAEESNGDTEGNGKEIQ